MQFGECGTGVAPVNHAQDARATLKTAHYYAIAWLATLDPGL